MMVAGSVTKCLAQISTTRSLFYWVTQMFNRMDPARVKAVGPDRACAEWLLRNGAAIKWKGEHTFLKDYNALPSLGEPERNIQAIDATDSAISDMGFSHFRGCKHVEELKLISCFYIQEEEFPLITLLGGSLNHLEIINCCNIGENGLNCVSELSKLKVLKLGNLPLVKNQKNVIDRLAKALPNCDIQFQF